MRPSFICWPSASQIGASNILLAKLTTGTWSLRKFTHQLNEFIYAPLIKWVVHTNCQWMRMKLRSNPAPAMTALRRKRSLHDIFATKNANEGMIKRSEGHQFRSGCWGLDPILTATTEITEQVLILHGICITRLQTTCITFLPRRASRDYWADIHCIRTIDAALPFASKMDAIRTRTFWRIRPAALDIIPWVKRLFSKKNNYHKRIPQATST